MVNEKDFNIDFHLENQAQKQYEDELKNLSQRIRRNEMKHNLTYKGFRVNIYKQSSYLDNSEWVCVRVTHKESDLVGIYNHALFSIKECIELYKKRVYNDRGLLELIPNGSSIESENLGSIYNTKTGITKAGREMFEYLFPISVE